MRGRGHAWQGSMRGRGVCVGGGVHGGREACVADTKRYGQ